MAISHSGTAHRKLKASFIKLFSLGLKQDHLRMNVAPDQTIILGLQIFLDHRSLNSVDQKILMTPPPTPPHPPVSIFRSFEVVWMSSEYYSSSFVLLPFCLLFFVFQSQYQCPYRWRSCHSYLFYQLVCNFTNVFAYSICCDVFM